MDLAKKVMVSERDDHFPSYRCVLYFLISTTFLLSQPWTFYTFVTAGLWPFHLFMHFLCMKTLFSICGVFFTTDPTVVQHKKPSRASLFFLNLLWEVR